MSNEQFYEETVINVIVCPVLLLNLLEGSSFLRHLQRRRLRKEITHAAVAQPVDIAAAFWLVS